MEVSTQTQTTIPQPTSNLSSASEASTLSSDFETFIKMLTVQMQNQDPLNPLDSSDFATQLATFSSVEQQVLTNDLLAELGTQFGTFGMAQLSGWIGMEASAEMPVHFDGAPVSLTVQGASLSEQDELVVRNANGIVVQRFAAALGRHDVQWAGVDESGAPLPGGTYHLTVESMSGEEVIAITPVLVHGKVTEARNDNGSTILVFNTGQEIPAQTVHGLRESN